MAKLPKQTPRVNIRISPETAAYLDALRKVGIHGKTHSEIVKMMIAREIERFIREGIIPLGRKN
jgi:predicted DNA-binding protein